MAHWLRYRGTQREIVLLLGLVQFALLLRIPAMRIGTWTDETPASDALRSTDPAMLNARGVARENNPPGYSLLVWPWTNVVAAE